MKQHFTQRIIRTANMVNEGAFITVMKNGVAIGHCQFRMRGEDLYADFEIDADLTLSFPQYIKYNTRRSNGEDWTYNVELFDRQSAETSQQLNP